MSKQLSQITFVPRVSSTLGTKTQKHHFPQKGAKCLEATGDFRIRAGNVQDVAGASCHTRQKVTKHYSDHINLKRLPLAKDGTV